MTSDREIRSHASFIWSVADKLRGVYKQSEYIDVYYNERITASLEFMPATATRAQVVGDARISLPPLSAQAEIAD